MLSSVWGELMYHTLGGYLHCDQSTCSIRKAAAYRLQLCSGVIHHHCIQFKHLQKQKVTF